MITKEYLEEEYLKKGRSQSDIAKELGINPKLLDYYIKKFGLRGKNRIKYKFNPLKIDINNPIFCYYFGLVVTDGYVDIKNKRVSLRMCNEGIQEVLENLKSYFEFEGEVRKYNKSYDLTLTSKELVEFFLKNGIDNNKNENLTFPKIIYDVSNECQLMFFRGLLDGDGNIKMKQSKNKISSNFRLAKMSKIFIQGIIDFLNQKFNFNVNMTFISNQTGNLYPQIFLKVKETETFLDWIYTPIYYEFKLVDKYTRYKLLKGEDIV